LLRGLIVIAVLLILMGCGNNLEREARSSAREAMAAGNFHQGSLLLLASCELLHEQSLYLLRMLNYEGEGNIYRMYLAWRQLMRFEVDDDFVREAAFEVMSEAVLTWSD